MIHVERINIAHSLCGLEVCELPRRFDLDTAVPKAITLVVSTRSDICNYLKLFNDTFTFQSLSCHGNIFEMSKYNSQQ